MPKRFSDPGHLLFGGWVFGFFDLAKALPLEPFCLSTLRHIFEFDLIIYRQYLQDFLYTGYTFLIYKLYIHVYLLPRTGNHMSLEIYRKYQNI